MNGAAREAERPLPHGCGSFFWPLAEPRASAGGAGNLPFPYLPTTTMENEPGTIWPRP